jgi:hypothetical protein
MWRGWLDDRCATDKPSASDTGTNRSKAAGEQSEPNKVPEPEKRATHSNAGDARANRSETALAMRENKRGKTAAAETNPYRRKLRDDGTQRAARYAPPRHRKHAYKVRTRVDYVYADRPWSCCYSEPVVYYRTPTYRDQVFLTDHILRPGR